MTQEKVVIKIFGREYEVTSGEDPLHIYALASFVDQKMREVSHTTNIVDTNKVAVLTAINIADELFGLKENKNSLSDSVNKKTEELVNLLESALK